VAHLRLDGELPCVALDAADEKSREVNDLPLRSDLASDLREWVLAQDDVQQAFPPLGKLLVDRVPWIR